MASSSSEGKRKRGEDGERSGGFPWRAAALVLAVHLSFLAAGCDFLLGRFLFLEMNSSMQACFQCTFWFDSLSVQHHHRAI